MAARATWLLILTCLAETALPASASAGSLAESRTPGLAAQASAPAPPRTIAGLTDQEALGAPGTGQVPQAAELIAASQAPPLAQEREGDAASHPGLESSQAAHPTEESCPPSRCPIAKVSRRVQQALARLGYAFGSLKRGPGSLQPAEERRSLNQAYYPMVAALHARAASLDEAEVRQILGQMTPARPARYGESEGLRVARLDLTPGWNDLPASSRRGIEYLSRTSAERNRFYDEVVPAGLSRRLFWAQPPEAYDGPLGRMSHILQTSMMPVGAYGDAFSLAVLGTTRVLNRLAKETAPPLAAAALNAHGDALRASSFRVANAANEHTAPELAPVAALLEGIRSLQQALGLVLMEPLPGAATGREALREVIWNGPKPRGLITDLAWRAPMGLLAPMNLRGRYFRQALVRGADGRVELSASVKRQLEDARTMAAVEHRRGVCPMATAFCGDPSLLPAGVDGPRTTGLQLLAETFWRVFGLVERSLEGGKRREGEA